MKFVSKLSNFRIMLKPGIPGNPIMAIPATQGVHALFVDGQFFTDEPDMIGMLKGTKQYNRDYFSVEEESTDPYAKSRKSSEPAHSVMEMGQGSHPGRVLPAPAAVNPAIKEAAEAMLTQLMPAIVAKVREQVLSEQGTTTTAISETAEPPKAAAKISKAKAAKAPEAAKDTTETVESL